MAEKKTYTLFRNVTDTTLRLVVSAGSPFPPSVRRENWVSSGSIEEETLPPHDIDEIEKAGFSLYRISWDKYPA